MAIIVVVVVAAAEAVANLMRESKSSQKILKTAILLSDGRTWMQEGSFEFFGWSDLLTEATGMCRQHHCSCDYAAKGVLLQWPSDSQANNSLYDQRFFPGHERTTTHLHLRYNCRRALMLRTSPEATTQAHLMFVTINSTKIQRGCSTPMDRSSYPKLPPSGLSSPLA